MLKSSVSKKKQYNSDAMQTSSAQELDDEERSLMFYHLEDAQ